MKTELSKSLDRCETGREPLALHGLLTDDELMTSTIEKQIAFREAISTPTRNYDEIDDYVADPLVEFNSSRRSEKSANRVLDILDELERSGH